MNTGITVTIGGNLDDVSVHEDDSSDGCFVPDRASSLKAAILRQE